MSAQGARGRRHRHPRDRGSVMVSVVGVMVVTFAFMLTLASVTTRHVHKAREFQDARLALAAAQAGIDDYLARLTDDGDYWRLGNVDAANPAFTTGQSIQGTGAVAGSYTYSVLDSTADIMAKGALRLKVTGTSGVNKPISRTLTATLTSGGQSGYAYISDKEVIDPDIMLNHENTGCRNYYYAGRSAIAESDLSDSAADDNKCRNLAWTTSDVVDGALHSNDALKISGAVTFNSSATTSTWPALSGSTATKTWWGTANPPLAAFSPKYGPAVAFSTAGTSSMKEYVAPDVDGNSSTAAGPGCYYQGATRITFTGSTMSVFSPGTTNAATPSRCFSVSNRSSTQTGLAIPPVIYVDAGTASCTFGAVGYPATAAGEHYENDGAGEVAWDDPDNGSAHVWGWLPNYNCKRGTAYVSGTAASSVTVATQDDIVVVGDVKVDSLTGPTMIGLLARACVWVWHPMTDDGDNIPGFVPTTTIQASVIAQEHSFLTSYWTHGTPLGRLTVTGTVVQKFRGPHGSTNKTGTHGYTGLTYAYDSRLAAYQPPYLTIPTGSGASATSWEVGSVLGR